MKQENTAHPRAIALLMAAVVLPFTPALAQDATTAPPPVAATVPAPAPAAPVVAPAAPPPPVFAAPSPIVQAVPPRPAPPPEAVEAVAPAPTAATRAARTQPRAATRPVARTIAAPVAEAPTTPTPVAEAPAAPLTETVAPEPSTAVEPVPTFEPVTEPAPVATGTPFWMWAIGGILALGALLFGINAARGRSRSEFDYDEPDYVAPAAVSPAARERASVATLAAAPLVAAPLAAAPIAAAATDERPWIGFSLTPIRAGTDGDDALVEYELVVENSGDVPAHDVRVSSFLLNGTSSSAEQALIDPIGEPQARTIDIAAHGSVPISTTIHIARSDLAAGNFLPKVIAEARYPLPGGGEGHFAARFAMGIADGDDVTAVDMGSDGTMRQDVGAQFEDVLESV